MTVNELLPKQYRNWLLISETFLTHQGEGASTGQLAFFVRLGACNLHCKWCDTPYTWSYSERLSQLHESGKQYQAASELTRIDLEKIAELVLDQPARLVVITGGEPLLQANTVSLLISRVNEDVRKHRFEIETAGTISPHMLDGYENVSFNVSPKLSGSGNTLTERFKPGILREFLRYDSRFKFVIDTRSEGQAREDLGEVEHIVGMIRIPDHRVWVMPCGTDKDDVVHGMQQLAPIAIEHGWNLSGRDHVLIWGNERGH